VVRIARNNHIEVKIMRRTYSNLLRDPIFGLLLVTPMLLWLTFTLMIPMIDAFRISFTSVRYLGAPGVFVGLSNFKRVLADPEFWQSVVHTLSWTVVNTAIQFLGSIGVAIVLNQEFWGKNIVRNWIILPWVLPTIVLAIVWKWILDPSHGIVNHILFSFGLVDKPVEFLSSPRYALLTAVLINCWRWTPYFAVIVLAALQTVPRELYEAATIDGASRLKNFMHVTVPSISSVLKVVLLNSFLWSANIFDTIWLLTRGGPLSSTTTMPIYIYSKAFRNFRFGEAAAASVLMFLFLGVLAVLYLTKVLREEELK